MAEDWIRVAVSVGASLVSGAVGMLAGVWRAGRNSAQKEQAVKDDYTAKINALREEIRAEDTNRERERIASRDFLAEQFKEAFNGIRRQIDEHRFYTEKDFMKKEDFRDFREEYREDMREIKQSISGIATRNATLGKQ